MKKAMMGLWLILLIPVIWAPQVRTEEFSAKDLPREGKSLSDFIPEGWTIEDQAKGDLNGDGVSDVAAILVQTTEEVENGRALIVLLGRGGGKFVLAGTNGKLIQCKGCGGVKEGQGVQIKKGVIVLYQWTGSREYAQYTWRFRYDPKSERFVMIGKDIDNADAGVGNGTIESFNYLTGRKIVETYRYDEKMEHKIATSTKKESGPGETPFLEDVEGEF